MWQILLILLILFWLYRSYYSHWDKRSVPGPTPLPIVGNFGKSLLGQLAGGEVITSYYRQYQEYPFVGIYRAATPILLIRDPEFVKNITIKDFKYFTDNDFYIDKKTDPIFSKHLFALKGTEWKNKKAQLSTCLTTKKVKAMSPHLQKSSEQMVHYIEKETKHGEALEARELCLKFTLSNVASCGFGLEDKTFEKERSDFRILADKFISPEGALNKYMFTLFFVFPNVAKLLKLKLISKDLEDGILDVIKKSLQFREENNIETADFLDSVTKLFSKNGMFQEYDLLSAASTFFSDTHETSSRVMSFLLFDLAANPDCQEKLRKEINSTLNENSNESIYEAIQTMQYLEACVKESTRKNSMAHSLAKTCTEDYTYTSTNPDFKQMTISLKVGDVVALPLTGFHSDPKYFEDPEQFKPERFYNNDTNANFLLLAFGSGPRACLGKHFAKVQIKIGLIYIIKNFKLTVSSKTKFPVQLDPFYFLRHVIGGQWIHFEKI